MAEALPGTLSQPLLADTSPTAQMRKLRLTELEKAAKCTQLKSVQADAPPGTLQRKGRAFQSNVGKWSRKVPSQRGERQRERRGFERRLGAEGQPVGRGVKDGKGNSQHMALAGQGLGLPGPAVRSLAPALVQGEDAAIVTREKMLLL